MRALVVHADPDPAGFTTQLFDAAVRGLEASGHDVETISLLGERFDWRMSADERRAYETDEPIVDEQVRAHAEALGRAEAIVFVYPTRWFGLPALLKGWIERVFVMGVAFELDPRTRRVRGRLRQVRRLAAVTTYPSSRLATMRYADGGRRTIGRSIRLTCNWRCRTTWLGLYGADRRTDSERLAFADEVGQRMGRL